MFTRKSDVQQFYAAARADATDTVAQPVREQMWQDDAEPAAIVVPEYRTPNATYDQQVAAYSGPDESIIGPDLKITGNVISRGRVRLEGAIEGDMRCTSLIVSQTGTVTGGIVAGEVAVFGRVAGTIKGERVNLYATAHVEGDITHQGIGVEMGTHYDGRLRWSSQPIDEVTEAVSGGWPNKTQG